MTVSSVTIRASEEDFVKTRLSLRSTALFQCKIVCPDSLGIVRPDSHGVNRAASAAATTGNLIRYSCFAMYFPVRYPNVRQHP